MNLVVGRALPHPHPRPRSRDRGRRCPSTDDRSAPSSAPPALLAGRRRPAGRSPASAVAVKDVFDVAGLVTGAGNPTVRRRPRPGRDPRRRGAAAGRRRRRRSSARPSPTSWPTPWPAATCTTAPRQRGRARAAGPAGRRRARRRRWPRAWPTWGWAPTPAGRSASRPATAACSAGGRPTAPSTHRRCRAPRPELRHRRACWPATPGPPPRRRRPAGRPAGPVRRRARSARADGRGVDAVDVGRSTATRRALAEATGGRARPRRARRSTWRGGRGVPRPPGPRGVGGPRRRGSARARPSSPPTSPPGSRPPPRSPTTRSLRPSEVRDRVAGPPRRRPRRRHGAGPPRGRRPAPAPSTPTRRPWPTSPGRGPCASPPPGLAGLPAVVVPGGRVDGLPLGHGVHRSPRHRPRPRSISRPRCEPEAELRSRPSTKRAMVTRMPSPTTRARSTCWSSFWAMRPPR